MKVLYPLILQLYKSIAWSCKEMEQKLQPKVLKAGTNYVLAIISRLKIGWSSLSTVLDQATWFQLLLSS